MFRLVFAGSRRAGLASLRSTTCMREACIHDHRRPSAAALPWCPQPHVRGFSTDFPMLGVEPEVGGSTPEDSQEGISEQRFHRAADATLGELLQKIDGYLQEQPQPGTSVDITEGKLQIQLGQDRGLVISKDPEARQLHTSGVHGDTSFALAADPEDGRWESVEGGRDLHDVIEQELEAATGKSADLEPEDHHGYGPDPT